MEYASEFWAGSRKTEQNDEKERIEKNEIKKNEEVHDAAPS